MQHEEAMAELATKKNSMDKQGLPADLLRQLTESFTQLL